MIRLVFDCLRSPYDFANVIQVALAIGECEIYVAGNSIKHESPKVTGKVRSWSSKLRKNGLLSLPIFYYDTYEQCITALRNKGLKLIGTSPTTGKSLYDQNFESDDFAIVFGTETSGLVSRKTSILDDLVKVPMTDGIDFMTLSVCVPIVAYEVYRQQKFGPSK